MDLQTIDLSQVNVIDVLLVVYLVFGTLRGLRRGLSGELARFVSLAVAIAAGWQFHEPIGEQLELYTRLSGTPARVAGFFCTVVVAGLLMLLLRLMLKNIMEFAFKGPIERVGGVTVGLLRALCVASLAVIAASLMPVPYLQQQVREESRVGRAITQVVLPFYQDLVVDHPEWGLPPLPHAAAPPADGSEDASDAPARDPRP